MENCGKEFADLLNKKLNRLVRITFEREARLNETERMHLNIIDGDTKEQKDIKVEVVKMISTLDIIKDGDCKVEVTNYGFLTIYNVLRRDDEGKIASMQAKKGYAAPSNYNVIPRAFIAGYACSKIGMLSALQKMV